MNECDLDCCRKKLGQLTTDVIALRDKLQREIDACNGTESNATEVVRLLNEVLEKQK